MIAPVTTTAVQTAVGWLEAYCCEAGGMEFVHYSFVPSGKSLFVIM